MDELRIRVPATLVQELAAEAEKRGCSAEEAVTEILAEYFDMASTGQHSSLTGKMLAAAGLPDGEAEEFLLAEWFDEVAKTAGGEDEFEPGQGLQAAVDPDIEEWFRQQTEPVELSPELQAAVDREVASMMRFFEEMEES